MPARSKRDHIISVALDVFYQNGFNATGVEKIITEASVSKKTLYNHFKSKDELILAVLRKRDEIFRNDLMRNVESLADTPRDQLSALFDAQGLWFKDKNFNGCMFINASAEFSDHNDPCHLVCKEHMRLINEYISDLAKKAGAQNPAKLAEQLVLLMSGAVVGAHVCGNCDTHKKAKEMAEIFIDRAIA